MVDRGVRHLREALFDVPEDRPPPIRERRERGVVAHRRDGLGSGGSHRPKDTRDLFFRVSEPRLESNADGRRLGVPIARAPPTATLAPPRPSPAAGISIVKAGSRLRPPRTSSSTTLSSIDESDPDSSITGRKSSGGRMRSPPTRCDSFARTPRTFPWMVLISPL